MSAQGTPIRVLITGSGGQLGTELAGTAPPGAELVRTDRAELDITDRNSVLEFVKEIKPDLIINAAAYTAVDKAESEPDLAFRINRDGAAHLAQAAKKAGARIIHVSTDYVFDGRQGSPYKPDDKPNPLNVYGESKLAGERAVQEITEGRGLIVRTAWVYSAHGHNFVKTMLRLLRERKEVRVVCDQIGTPTHARGLADALWRFAGRADLHGIYHWTDAGVASWYDFAEAVRSCRLRREPRQDVGLLYPIPSSQYNTPAVRPAYCVLDKFSTWSEIGSAKHWAAGLSEMLQTLNR